MEERKKFRLADVVLSVICVVFVAEAAAPVASIGNSQYFWWVFMMIAFLLPYGMISSELGTTYTGDGGLYDWINKAFPRSKWGARASWYYWINFPLWMASLAVVCPELLSVLTGLQFGWLAKLLIELAFIWIVTWIAFYPVCDSIIILNISAAIKMILALTVGVLGIVYVVKNGVVNDMAFRTFLPGFDLHSLSYISVIIFNFLGFEVVCTYADNMRDPKRQIPQAIITGGIVILLMLEPHLSASIIIMALAIVMMFVGGIKLSYLLIGMGGAGALLLIAGKFVPYVHKRIVSWRDPFADTSAAGYQIVQSLYSIGSGGFLGLGLGQSRQKYLYLPEEHNDYIFSIVCEELGYVGAIAILILFALLICRGYWIAAHSPDRYSFLVGVGITTLLSIQVFLNIAVVTNLIPCTGISLPFFSYGGTALLMQLGEMGIILSISRDIPTKKAR
mgnify:CR=1 FL=1